METAAKWARAGDRVITMIAIVVITLMFSYGGYSLYDNWLVEQGGFTGELMKYKPTPANPYSLRELMALNPDVIGWITLDDTHIDQPIVQGEDDLEYVNKDVLGNFSLSGAIFLSCLNHRDFSDLYNITYGHHMENGGMYGDLTRFLDAETFESHRSGTLFNDQYQWEIEIFGVMKTDAANPEVYHLEQYQSPQGLAQLQDYLRRHCLYYREPAALEASSILALSTCYDIETNGRVLVFGRLSNRKEVHLDS